MRTTRTTGLHAPPPRLLAAFLPRRRLARWPRRRLARWPRRRLARLPPLLLPLWLPLLVPLAAPGSSLAAWDPLGDLAGAEVVFDLLEASDQTLYAATYPDGKVFVSLDAGESWDPAAPLPGAIVAYSLAERPDGAVVAGTFPRGDVFITTNHGVSWLETPGPPSAMATEIHALLQASNGQLYAGCAPSGHVFRSLNGGVSWILSAQLPGTVVPWCLVEGPPGTLWAGTVRGMGIFRSTNWGGSWDQVGTFWIGNMALDSPCIAAMLPVAQGDAMYAGMVMRGHGSVGGVFESTDDGQSWQLVQGLGGIGGVWALLETAAGGVWAGLATREEDIVHRLSPAGTWSSTGLLAGAREVFDLLETSTGDILAGTAPNGDVFRYNPASASVTLDGLVPAPARLTGRPNPFGGLTVLSFTTAVPREVSLAIYSAGGRRVRTLVDGPLAPGTHTVHWDGRDGSSSRLAAGVYFGVLRSGGDVTTRKLVLIDH